MKTQPNFEKLKSLFYMRFLKSTEGDIEILKEQTRSTLLLPSFNKRHEQFRIDFNNWLNIIDIRCAGDLIDALIKFNVSIPKWMKNKNFVIDYNNRGYLDLIKIN